MQMFVLSLALAGIALAGDRVTFADDRYSLEFPQGWKKGQAPSAGAEFARESPDKQIIISVNRTEIPKGAAADLEGTAKDSAAKLKQAFKSDKAPEISEGGLDGCEARFVILTPDDPQAEGAMGVFAIFVDAKKDLITLRAIMATPITEENREATMKIVNSFRREKEKSE
ncbi:MAG: hypothetical protein AAGB14_15615 [Verrucomicrobiota bacterium]